MDYFYDLGVSDCYASPLLTVRSGGTHGYDITDQPSASISPSSPGIIRRRRLFAPDHARAEGKPPHRLRPRVGESDSSGPDRAILHLSGRFESTAERERGLGRFGRDAISRVRRAASRRVHRATDTRRSRIAAGAGLRSLTSCSTGTCECTK